jgi:hypothetical protein
MTDGAGTATKTKLTPEQQSAILDWTTKAKIPIIPCDSKSKSVNYHGWNEVDFSQTDFGANLANGLYDQGIALVLGKTLSGTHYSFALDFNGWDAVAEWFGNWEKVLSSSQKTRIEWHQDKGRIHYIFLAKRPVANRKIQIKGSVLEIRCENQLLFASPSIHPDGNPWTVLGTIVIAVLDEMQLLSLEAKIDSLSQGYMSDENKQRYITWLEDSNTIIEEGSRHDANKTLGCSYYYRYRDGWKDLTDDQRYDRLQKWNLQHCIPPLPEKELKDIWKWIVARHRKNRDEQHQQLQDKRKDVAALIYDPLNMPGCVSYQINSIPDKYVLGTPDNKLVEVERKYTTDAKSNLVTSHLITNKTFTACKPVRIIKHKNPLSFLELKQRYTIEFRGSEQSGNFTIKHKTLSEIVAELKNGNLLSEYGLDVAIIAQIKGFEKAELLEVNDDMNYTGFFPAEGNSQIIASNVDIATVDILKLKDALEYINELAKVGYQNRLDLLAHGILFGIIAPCSFIFKVTRAPILEWMHLYGKPNASKSTSGRIILAIDAHEKDDDYNVNMGHVDSTARLGDTISQTTFPKLVDEMDFTDNKMLINNVKSAIDQPRLRKILDTSRRAEYIPALSSFIMTSNPPPPLNDAAFMKRIAARYFPDTETHFKDQQASKEFDALLQHLGKLHTLGQFRNKFIMDNQQLILDKKLTPLEKAKRILIAAYESAQLLVPCWLMRKQLEQKHLEESIEDNSVIVKRAFETYIDVNFRNWQHTEAPEDKALALPKEISSRLMKLIDSNLLPDIKRAQNKNIIIRRGILLELYKYGVTNDQLPNLKALADYITGASYRKSHGNKVVVCAAPLLSDYFDKVEDNV